MNRRGAGLAELLSAIFLLTFLFAGTVLIFQAGTRGFQQASKRLGSVGDAERFSRVVKRDITLTHYGSLETKQRSASTPDGLVRRDGLSLAGLSDWADPANFQDTQPLWNRHVVLYSTQEKHGRLFRLEIDAGGAFQVNDPFTNFNACLMDSPGGIPGLGRVTMLTKEVYSFEVTLDPGRG